LRPPPIAGGDQGVQGCGGPRPSQGAIHLPGLTLHDSTGKDHVGDGRGVSGAPHFGRILGIPPTAGVRHESVPLIELAPCCGTLECEDLETTLRLRPHNGGVTRATAGTPVEDATDLTLILHPEPSLPILGEEHAASPPLTQMVTLPQLEHGAAIGRHLHILHPRNRLVDRVTELAHSGSIARIVGGHNGARLSARRTVRTECGGFTPDTGQHLLARLRSVGEGTIQCCLECGAVHFDEVGVEKSQWRGALTEGLTV
jgi:hypothetical protein